MIPQSLGNNFWTFTIKDSLNRTYPDGFSGTMIEFSTVKVFHNGTITKCLVVCELLSVSVYCMTNSHEIGDMVRVLLPNENLIEMQGSKFIQ